LCSDDNLKFSPSFQLQTAVKRAAVCHTISTETAKQT